MPVAQTVTVFVWECDIKCATVCSMFHLSRLLCRPFTSFRGEGSRVLAPLAPRDPLEREKTQRLGPWWCFVPLDPALDPWGSHLLRVVFAPPGSSRTGHRVGGRRLETLCNYSN